MVKEFDISHVKNGMCAAAPLGESIQQELMEKQKMAICQGILVFSMKFRYRTHKLMYKKRINITLHKSSNKCATVHSLVVIGKKETL